MARVKRGVTSHKRHKRLLHEAEGRTGTNRKLIKRAKEAQLHALAYATRDRKQRKRDMRQLWIIRINAAARLNGITYGNLIAGLKKASVEIDQDARRHRRARRRDLWPHRRGGPQRLNPRARCAARRAPRPGNADRNPRRPRRRGFMIPRYQQPPQPTTDWTATRPWTSPS